MLFKWINKRKFLLIIIFLPLLFFGRYVYDFNKIFFPFEDVVVIFSHEKELIKESFLKFHEIPLWNQYIFSGYPIIGNSPSAIFYPLNFITLLLPVDQSIGISFIVHFILLGLFTYIFCLALGLKQTSALLSSILIMFCGTLTSLIYPGHLVLLSTFIWLPLILFFLEKAILTERRIFFIYLSIPIGLTLLAGQIQVAVYSLVSVLLYFLLRTTSLYLSGYKLQNLIEKSILFCLSLFVGSLLAMVEIMPAAEMVAYTARAKGLNYQFAAEFALHPLQIISFIVPYFFGNPQDFTYWGKGSFWGPNGYIGVLPIIFALIAVFLDKFKFKFILMSLIFFSLLYSLGNHSILFPLLFNSLPILNSFRAPSRFLFEYSFFTIIMAGFGFEFLTQKFKKNTIKKFKLINNINKILLVTALIVSLILFSKYGLNIFISYILKDKYATEIDRINLFANIKNDLFLIVTQIFIFFALTKLWVNSKINKSFFSYALILIISIDLFIFNIRFLSTKDIDFVYKPQNFISILKNDTSNFRVFDMDGYFIPTTLKNKIENITGVQSIYLSDYRDFIWLLGKHNSNPFESFFEINTISNPLILDLLNTKYILTSNKIDSTNLELASYYKNVRVNHISKQVKTVYLYKNKNYLPRAYLVPNAKVLPKDKIYETIRTGNFDPKKNVLLEKYPKGFPLKNKTEFKELNVTSEGPNKIRVKTNNTYSGFLVMSEIYYPGWKAYVNGKETEIYRANFILRAIKLREGINLVEFKFKPYSYLIGLIVSATSLLLLILILIFYKKINLLKNYLDKPLRNNFKDV